MTRLSDILAGAYTPITINLDEKAHRFLAHLARIGGMGIDDMAKQILVTGLVLEAEVLTDVLNPPVDENPHPSMQDAAHCKPDDYVTLPKRDLLTEAEIEEAAKNHVQIPENPE